MGSAFGTLCRLSVCLSVCLSVDCRLSSASHLSVTFCIVERIGNQGQKVDFLDRRHISTSGFASTAIETWFALVLPVQSSNRY